MRLSLALQRPRVHGGPGPVRQGVDQERGQAGVHPGGAPRPRDLRQVPLGDQNRVRGRERVRGAVGRLGLRLRKRATSRTVFVCVCGVAVVV